MIKTININTTAEVDLDQFTTSELLEEIRERGNNCEINTLTRKLYEKKRTGRTYTEELDKLIFEILGKIV